MFLYQKIVFKNVINLYVYVTLQSDVKKKYRIEIKINKYLNLMVIKTNCEIVKTISRVMQLILEKKPFSSVSFYYNYYCKK